MYSWIRNCWSKIAGLYKGGPSYRRILQPSKENIKHFETWNFLTFFFFCGSFLPSWIRTRIRNRIHWPDWIRIQSGSGTLIGTDLDLLVDIPESVVDVHVELLEECRVLGKHILQYITKFVCLMMEGSGPVQINRSGRPKYLRKHWGIDS